MARRIQSTTNSLIALAVGRRHKLALRQRKKNDESLLEKSGFRPFQNVIQSTTIWGSKIHFQHLSRHCEKVYGKRSYNKYKLLPKLKPKASAWESDERPPDVPKTSEGSVPQNQEKQLPEQKDSMDLTVSVHFETKGDGEHVMKIKGFSPSSTEEDNVERAKQMAHQKAAVLLLYGEMLQEMGKKWRAQSQASDSNE